MAEKILNSARNSSKTNFAIGKVFIIKLLSILTGVMYRSDTQLQQRPHLHWLLSFQGIWYLLALGFTIYKFQSSFYGLSQSPVAPEDLDIDSDQDEVSPAIVKVTFKIANANTRILNLVLRIALGYFLPILPSLISRIKSLYNKNYEKNIKSITNNFLSWSAYEITFVVSSSIFHLVGLGQGLFITIWYAEHGNSSSQKSILSTLLDFGIIPLDIIFCSDLLMDTIALVLLATLGIVIGNIRNMLEESQKQHSQVCSGDLCKFFHNQGNPVEIVGNPGKVRPEVLTTGGNHYLEHHILPIRRYLDWFLAWREVESITGFLTALLFADYVTTLCFNFFIAVSATMDLGVVNMVAIPHTIRCALIIVKMISFSSVASNLHDEVQNLRNGLLEAHWCGGLQSNTSSENQIQVSMGECMQGRFMSHLLRFIRKYPICLSASGFFNVTRTTLINITSVSITCLVILLQFHMSEKEGYKEE